MTTAPPTAAPESPSPTYNPTKSEQAALNGQFARGDKAKPAPRLKLAKKAGTNTISVAHKDQVVGHLLLMEAIGTANADFLNGLLKQLANVTAQGQAPDEDGMNFVMAVIKGVEPKDQIEALLAAQMATVHLATMTFARRLSHVETIPQQDSAERALNKLARTFAMQLEALKRYRSGGEQKVIVQHVHVAEGGKAAVVGAIAQGGGDGGESEGKPCIPPARLAHDAATGAVLPPLRRQDPEREPVPIARNAREDALPAARRRQHWSANT